MKKILKNLIYIILIIICLTGCTQNNNEDKTIKDKTNEEISYVEDSIFNIVNKYAKSEYVKDDAIDWDEIFKDEKRINDVLDTIILDLSELDIDNNDLVSFSDELNQLVIATADKNETELLVRLSNMYAIIPKFVEKSSDDNNEIMKKEFKSLVLASFSLANANNWTDAKTVIQTAEDRYNTMMNDVDYMKDNSYNLNRVYVLLEELKNAISLENVELVRAKYIAIAEKI